MKILVLFGGDSAEREVSLRSGAAVIAALTTSGHQVIEHDTRLPLSDEVIMSVDAVFPVLHGQDGEDGILQERLERLEQCFVGTGSIGSKLCFDKWQYRQTLAENYIQIADGELVDENTFWNSPLAKKPFVLKPYNGGSSIDTIICRTSRDDIAQATVAAIFRRNPTMLLEALIDGIEITAGVLDNKALPVIEIIPPDNGEFDYANKYNGNTRELCPPQNIDVAVQAKAQTLALQIHTLTGCSDLSRTDMIVTHDGELYVLETNTIPGMTDQSLFPKAAQTAGITMPQLVDQLVHCAARN